MAVAPLPFIICSIGLFSLAAQSLDEVAGNDLVLGVGLGRSDLFVVHVRNWPSPCFVASNAAFDGRLTIPRGVSG